MSTKEIICNDRQRKVYTNSSDMNELGVIGGDGINEVIKWQLKSLI